MVDSKAVEEFTRHPVFHGKSESPRRQVLLAWDSVSATPTNDGEIAAVITRPKEKMKNERTLDSEINEALHTFRRAASRPGHVRIIALMTEAQYHTLQQVVIPAVKNAAEIARLFTDVESMQTRATLISLLEQDDAARGAQHGL
jgi:hypothetical protein